MNLSGSWKGSYSYGDSDSFKEEFEVSLSDSDGVFQGDGSDLSSDKLKFTVSGFFEGGILSFIKRYEGFYFHDDQGNTYFEQIIPSAEIQYTGTYNLKEQAFIGTWEILINEEQVGLQEEFETEYTFGEFRLSKIHLVA